MEPRVLDCCRIGWVVGGVGYGLWVGFGLVLVWLVHVGLGWAAGCYRICLGLVRVVFRKLRWFQAFKISADIFQAGLGLD